MKLFSEFSGQFACEIGQRQNLCLITFVYCFVSLWPASEIVDGLFELCSALANFGFDKKWNRTWFLVTMTDFYFLTPEKTDCPLVRLGP